MRSLHAQITVIVNYSFQREMVDEVAKPLSIIFEMLQQSNEVPTDWRRGNITLIFKKE